MPAKKPKSALSFQDLILALQEFWAERGCVVMQPYDKEMGAGTFHPATFLRAIGPEPWSAAYVQPSRRPTDGRYGDNPFRLQHKQTLKQVGFVSVFGMGGTQVEIDVPGMIAPGTSEYVILAECEYAGTLSPIERGQRLRYRPAPDFFGTDVCPFWAWNGLSISLPGLAYVTVEPKNDAPLYMVTSIAQSVLAQTDWFGSSLAGQTQGTVTKDLGAWAMTAKGALADELRYQVHHNQTRKLQAIGREDWHESNHGDVELTQIRTDGTIAKVSFGRSAMGTPLQSTVQTDVFAPASDASETEALPLTNRGTPKTGALLFTETIHGQLTQGPPRDTAAGTVVDYQVKKDGVTKTLVRTYGAGEDGKPVEGAILWATDDTGAAYRYFEQDSSQGDLLIVEWEYPASVVESLDSDTGPSIASGAMPRKMRAYVSQLDQPGLGLGGLVSEVEFADNPRAFPKSLTYRQGARTLEVTLGPHFVGEMPRVMRAQHGGWYILQLTVTINGIPVAYEIPVETLEPDLDAVIDLVPQGPDAAAVQEARFVRPDRVFADLYQVYVLPQYRVPKQGRRTVHNVTQIVYLTQRADGGWFATSHEEAEAIAKSQWKMTGKVSLEGMNIPDGYQQVITRIDPDTGDTVERIGETFGHALEKHMVVWYEIDKDTRVVVAFNGKGEFEKTGYLEKRIKDNPWRSLLGQSIDALRRHRKKDDKPTINYTVTRVDSVFAPNAHQPCDYMQGRPDASRPNLKPSACVDGDLNVISDIAVRDDGTLMRMTFAFTAEGLYSPLGVFSDKVTATRDKIVLARLPKFTSAWHDVRIDYIGKQLSQSDVTQTSEQKSYVSGLAKGLKGVCISGPSRRSCFVEDDGIVRKSWGIDLTTGWPTELSASLDSTHRDRTLADVITAIRTVYNRNTWGALPNAEAVATELGREPVEDAENAGSLYGSAVADVSSRNCDGLEPRVVQEPTGPVAEVGTAGRIDPFERADWLNEMEACRSFMERSKKDSRFAKDKVRYSLTIKYSAWERREYYLVRDRYDNNLRSAGVITKVVVFGVPLSEIARRKLMLQTEYRHWTWGPVPPGTETPYIVLDGEFAQEQARQHGTGNQRRTFELGDETLVVEETWREVYVDSQGNVLAPGADTSQAKREPVLMLVELVSVTGPVAPNMGCLATHKARPEKTKQIWFRPGDEPGYADYYENMLRRVHAPYRSLNHDTRFWLDDNIGPDNMGDHVHKRDYVLYPDSRVRVEPEFRVRGRLRKWSKAQSRSQMQQVDLIDGNTWGYQTLHDFDPEKKRRGVDQTHWQDKIIEYYGQDPSVRDSLCKRRYNQKVAVYFYDMSDFSVATNQNVRVYGCREGDGFRPNAQPVLVDVKNSSNLYLDLALESQHGYATATLADNETTAFSLRAGKTQTIYVRMAPDVIEGQEEKITVAIKTENKNNLRKLQELNVKSHYSEDKCIPHDGVENSGDTDGDNQGGDSEQGDDSSQGGGDDDDTEGVAIGDGHLSECQARPDIEWRPKADGTAAIELYEPGKSPQDGGLSLMLPMTTMDYQRNDNHVSFDAPPGGCLDESLLSSLSGINVVWVNELCEGRADETCGDPGDPKGLPPWVAQFIANEEVAEIAVFRTSDAPGNRCFEVPDDQGGGKIGHVMIMTDESAKVDFSNGDIRNFFADEPHAELLYHIHVHDHDADTTDLGAVPLPSRADYNFLKDLHKRNGQTTSLIATTINDYVYEYGLEGTDGEEHYHPEKWAEACTDWAKQGLVAHWTFDDENNRGHDSSGLDHDAVFHIEEFSGGNKGQALSGAFNAPQTVDLQLAPNDGFLISFWAFQKAGEDGGAVIGNLFTDDSGRDVAGWELRLGKNMQPLLVLDGESTDAVQVRAANPSEFATPKTGWHHVALLWQPPRDKDDFRYARIFIDGSEVALSYPGGLGTMPHFASTAVLVVGAGFHNGGVVRRYAGALDDISIQRGAYTVSDVQKLMEQGVQQGLVGYWRFDIPNTLGFDWSGRQNRGAAKPNSSGKTTSPGRLRSNLQDGEEELALIGSLKVESEAGSNQAPADLQFGPNDNFLVSAWVWPPNDDKDYSIIGNIEPGQERDGGWEIRITKNFQPFLYIAKNGDTAGQSFGIAEELLTFKGDLRSWHHVAILWQEGELTFFLDGESSKFGILGTDFSSPKPIVVGQGYPGAIDDVAIFRGNYTAEDVKSQYEAQSDPGFWLYEWFRGFVGDTISDIDDSVSGKGVKVASQSIANDPVRVEALEKKRGEAIVEIFVADPDLRFVAGTVAEVAQYILDKEIKAGDRRVTFVTNFSSGATESEIVKVTLPAGMDQLWGAEKILAEDGPQIKDQTHTELLQGASQRYIVDRRGNVLALLDDGKSRPEGKNQLWHIHKLYSKSIAVMRVVDLKLEQTFFLVRAY